MVRAGNEQTERSEFIRGRFCILDPNEILADPEEHVENAHPYCAQAALTLRNNLTAIVNTANTPFLSAKTSVILDELNKWLRANTQGQGQSSSIQRAQSELLKLLNEPQEIERLFEEIYIQLEQYTKIQSLYASYEEIHSQAIVMMAGALEVFFTDVFTALFNQDPKQAARFLCDPSIKKNLNKWRIDIEEVMKMDFILIDKMGDYIFANRRIDSLSFFQKTSEIVLGKRAVCCEPVIEELFERRHLIVHRRGYSDLRRQLDDSKMNKGRIVVTPQEIDRSLRACWEVGLSTCLLLA